MINREMYNAAKAFEEIWVNSYWTPASVQVDIELLHKFTKELNYFRVKFMPAPAWLHKKLDVVKQKNSVIRILTHNLLHDAQYAKETLDINVRLTEVLSRAAYLSSILYGGKLLSSFEMFRGYTLSFLDLPKTPLSAKLVKAHQAQVSMCALAFLRKSYNQQTLSFSDFQKDEWVFYFKRGHKFGTWEKALVVEGADRFLALSTSPKHRGKPMRAGLS